MKAKTKSESLNEIIEYLVSHGSSPYIQIDTNGYNCILPKEILNEEGKIHFNISPKECAEKLMINDSVVTFYTYINHNLTYIKLPIESIEGIYDLYTNVTWLFINEYIDREKKLSEFYSKIEREMEFFKKHNINHQLWATSEKYQIYILLNFMKRISEKGKALRRIWKGG